MICSGSLNELLGTDNTYQIKGRGGDKELNQWVSNLKFEQDNSWHGQLQGNPDDFLARLRQMNVQIIALNLSRPSLEEFFLQQLSTAKIVNK